MVETSHGAVWQSSLASDGAVVVAVAVVEIAVVLIVSVLKREGGDRSDMKTEVRGHVVVVIVVAVAIAAVVVVDAENAENEKDVESIVDCVVAARNRAVVDRLVQTGVMRSVGETDRGRQ